MTRYAVVVQPLFDNLLTGAATAPKDSAHLVDQYNGLLTELTRATSGEPELDSAVWSPVTAGVERLQHALLGGRRGAALDGCVRTLESVTGEAVRFCSNVGGGTVPRFAPPSTSGPRALRGSAQKAPARQPDRSFASLKQFVDALTTSVGCHDRRDGIGGPYTKQDLGCRSTSGKDMVALFGMSSADSGRFIADRREHSSTSGPVHLFLVKGSN